MDALFSCSSYKTFLAEYLSTQKVVWGLKSRLCQVMGIHNAYLTQVLGGSKHLSLEQLERLAKFLGFTDSELDFFLTLAQRDRAGSKSLEDHFNRKLDRMREARRDVTARLGKKDGITEKDQEVYYSSWHYGAIHTALLVPELQTVSELSRRLNLSPEKIREVLEFLISIGLVKSDGNSRKFTATTNWIRLPKTSPLIGRHHSNLRVRALDAIYGNRESELHYSGYFAFSRQDAGRIRDVLLNTLKEMQEIIAPSPSEDIYAVCMDLFPL